MPCFFSLSPALLSRIDRLSACDGRWIVDCRSIEGNYSYALRSLSDYWPFDHADGSGHRYWHSLDGLPNNFKLGSPEDAAQYCAATKWEARLLFSPALLDADCLWPGGYSAPSLHRSNNRTFQDLFSEELFNADGDADGLALDVRFLTDEMLETIESLECYPLLSEDDHCELSIEDQSEAWSDWAERDFSQALESRLSSLMGEDLAEQTIESLSGEALFSLFSELSEAANEYWQEENYHGWWIDTEAIASQASDELLLSLLSQSLSEELQRALSPLLSSSQLSLSLASREPVG